MREAIINTPLLNSRISKGHILSPMMDFVVDNPVTQHIFIFCIEFISQ